MFTRRPERSRRRTLACRLWCPMTLVAAVTMFATAGPGATASASALPGPLVFMPLPVDTPFTGGDNEKVLISGTFRLQTGESRRVLGRLVTTSTSAAEVYLEAAVRCLNDSTGQQSGISAWTGRNHVGTGPLALSPSLLFTAPYPLTDPDPSRLFAAPNPFLLFTAPTAGTYTCQLIGQTGISGGNHLTAVADGTWLQVSSSDEVGSQWWQNPSCDSEGTEPTCTYLGGSVGSPEGFIFDDGTPWTAAGNVTAAAVSATVELTTCNPGTHSCTRSHWGHSGGDSGGSTVTSHLEFTQLDSRLVACKVTRTSDVTSTIRNDAHHFMIQYSLDNVPVSTTCGTRLFRVLVDVTHVSGNPVKIDGTRPGGTEPESYTNAFVTVPDLRVVPDLYGDTLTAASQALQAAGLVLGSHGLVATDEKAMNGLVASQALSPGTQIPVGSAVAVNLGHYQPLMCGPHPC